MRFSPTPLAGAYVIDPEPARDDRGFFARTFCADEMAAHGLATVAVQCNLSDNLAQHTLRGLHYQVAPHAEPKLVSCAAGAIFDVIVDLRPDSPSHRQWFGLELSAGNLRMLYVPAGLAHGFLTLTEDARVFYQMFARYHPASARGVRWDDPAFGIAWPHPPAVISERDAAYPAYLAAPAT